MKILYSWQLLMSIIIYLFLSCQILDWLAGLLLHAMQLAPMLQEPLGEWFALQFMFSTHFL